MPYKKIQNNGWQQGKCLQINNPEPPFEEPGFYILISQDCDIVNPDFNKESYVEFLFAKKIASINKSFKNENPRILHLETSSVKIEINAVHCPIFLPRQQLITLIPCEEIFIDGENRTRLVGWKTNRYKRPAFPDTFNRRRNSVKKEIVKILTESLDSACT